VAVRIGDWYADDWGLAFDACHQLMLLDIDTQVPPLEVSRNAECDIEVPDYLRPFVWQGRLFFLFLLACSCLFGWGRFCVSWS
jgi:hypothetical protein